MSEENQNIGKEKKENCWVKTQPTTVLDILKNEKIYYLFFIILSFCLVSLPSTILIKFPDFRILGLATGSAIGFAYSFCLLGILIICTVICIFCLIVYIVLIKLKKFHSSIFIIPFILTFLLNHMVIYYLYSSYFIYPHHLNIYSILFFIQFHFIYLAFSYIPFIILFYIIAIIVYIRYLTSKNRKVKTG